MKFRSLVSILLMTCLIFFAAACSNSIEAINDKPAGGGDEGDAPTIPNYLCFTSTGNSSIKIKITEVGGPIEPLPVLEYSKDGATWEDFVIGTTEVIFTDGEKVYLRGDNNSFSDDNGYLTFVMTGSIAASGNIMSLLDKTCESVEIPDKRCFYALFSECDVLTAAPELPAATLVDGCYAVMFKDCSNLSSITVHFTDWNDGNSTGSWVNGAAETGTFTCPSDLPITIDDVSYILTGWSVNKF